MKTQSSNPKGPRGGTKIVTGGASTVRTGKDARVCKQMKGR